MKINAYTLEKILNEFKPTRIHYGFVSNTPHIYGNIIPKDIYVNGAWLEIRNKNYEDMGIDVDEYINLRFDDDADEVIFYNKAGYISFRFKMQDFNDVQDILSDYQ